MASAVSTSTAAPKASQAKQTVESAKWADARKVTVVKDPKSNQWGVSGIGRKLHPLDVGKFMVRTAPTKNQCFSYIPIFLSPQKKLLPKEKIQKSINSEARKILKVNSQEIKIAFQNFEISLSEDFLDDNWIESDKFYSAIAKHN